MRSLSISPSSIGEWFHEFVDWKRRKRFSHWLLIALRDVYDKVSLDKTYLFLTVKPKTISRTSQVRPGLCAALFCCGGRAGNHGWLLNRCLESTLAPRTGIVLGSAAGFMSYTSSSQQPNDFRSGSHSVQKASATFSLPVKSLPRTRSL